MRLFKYLYVERASDKAGAAVHTLSVCLLNLFSIRYRNLLVTSIVWKKRGLGVSSLGVFSSLGVLAV